MECAVTRGSGCGSVGRAVRGSNPVISKRLYRTFICFFVNCIEKIKRKKKEAENGPFLKNTQGQPLIVY